MTEESWGKRLERIWLELVYNFLGSRKAVPPQPYAPHVTFRGSPLPSIEPFVGYCRASEVGRGE